MVLYYIYIYYISTHITEGVPIQKTNHKFFGGLFAVYFFDFLENCSTKNQPKIRKNKPQTDPK